MGDESTAANQVSGAAPGAPTGGSVWTPGEEQMGLIKDVHTAVIEATKHQDEKIGRLLTAIAFLTAAALAVASLKHGVPLATKFHLSSGLDLKIAITFLILFTALVVAVVMLLLVALATPYKLTGPNDDVEPTAPIFFNSIVRIGKEDWHNAWRQHDPELRNARYRAYVDETYKLSVRCRYKYELRMEALAIFALALLTLVLAALFIAFASGDGPRSHEGIYRLTLSQSVILSATFALYAFSQLYLGRVRWPVGTPKYPPASSNMKFALSFSALIAWLSLQVSPNPTWRGIWISGVIVLSALAMRTYFVIARPEWELKIKKARQNARTKCRRIRNLAIITVFSLAATAAAWTDSYGGQLLAVFLLVALVVPFVVLAPVLEGRWSDLDLTPAAQPSATPNAT